MNDLNKNNEFFDEVERRKVSLVIEELIEQYGTKSVAEALDRCLRKAKATSDKWS
jgi:hypothetical protein